MSCGKAEPLWRGFWAMFKWGISLGIALLQEIFNTVHSKVRRVKSFSKQKWRLLVFLFTRSRKNSLRPGVKRAGDAPEPIQALNWHVPSGRVYCWYQISDALHITGIVKNRRMLYLTLFIIPSKLSFLLRALPSRACFPFCFAGSSGKCSLKPLKYL